MNTIRHIVEPSRLLLIWQGPEYSSRRRWVVGELTRNDAANDGVTLSYLFDTPDFQGAKEEGFRGYPAFSLSQQDHRSGVMEALMHRLPPRKRGDYRRYLSLFCLAPDLPVSDFALLGYTEARLPSDGFSIVNPFEDVTGPCEFVADISSFHRYRVEGIQPGDPVVFEAEPDNLHDPNAIKVNWHGHRIGYVNRHQAAAFGRWMSEGRLHATVERLRLDPNSVHAFMFVEVAEARQRRVA